MDNLVNKGAYSYTTMVSPVHPSERSTTKDYKCHSQITTFRCSLYVTTSLESEIWNRRENNNLLEILWVRMKTSSLGQYIYPPNPYQHSHTEMLRNQKQYSACVTSPSPRRIFKSADIRCVNEFITLYFLTTLTVYQITISSTESFIKTYFETLNQIQ